MSNVDDDRLLIVAAVKGAVQCACKDEGDNQCQNDSSVIISSYLHGMSREPRCTKHAAVVFADFMAEVG